MALACSDRGASFPAPSSPDPSPPTARTAPLEELLADRRAVRHASDGGGRAWIERDPARPASVVARAPAHIDLVYEAGPDGIAVGGAVVMLVGPYWRWSTPQVEDRDAPGYTRVECAASGVEIDASTPAPWTLRMVVRGSALSSRERIALAYGAGEAGAKTDDFAERGSRFWFRVDGDGDGVSALVPDCPRVDVAAGPAAQMVVHVPSTAAVGDRVRISVALLDAWANAWVEWEGTVHLEASSDALDLPAAIVLARADRGVKSAVAVVRSRGVVRVAARAESASGALGPSDASGPSAAPAASGASVARAIRAESNALVIDGGPRILWADLHGHSNLSDGTGLPEDYYRYARDVAALDCAALTDHDHWGIEFLDEHPSLWSDIQSATAANHAPGSFVTVLGFEWTSWIHGHRHVLYFADRGALRSSFDPTTDAPDELWGALRADADHALTIAHHPAGGPVALNWSYPPDAALEPVVEVVSVHGSSEAIDSPRVIYDYQEGAFARDALARGYTLGFIGSGDTHDGHPGLGHLQGGSGGVAAVLARDCTREAVLSALRERACYATSGPRIVVRAELAGRAMGSIVAASSVTGAVDLSVRVVAESELDRIEIVRGSRVADSVAAGGARELEHRFSLTGLAAGEFVYVRAVQADAHFAVSSPWYVRESPH